MKIRQQLIICSNIISNWNISIILRNIHDKRGLSTNHQVRQFHCVQLSRTEESRNRLWLHGVALFGETRGKSPLFQRVRRRNGFFRTVRLIRPLLLSRARVRHFYIAPLSRYSEAHETFRPKKCCVLILCSRSSLYVYTHVTEAFIRPFFISFPCRKWRTVRWKFVIL